MSPKLTLPSVPLHCPGFPKSSDFIALDCTQFGNRIGDSCPGLPLVAHRIGDGIGDGVHLATGAAKMQASSHTGFQYEFGRDSCQAASPVARLQDLEFESRTGPGIHLALNA